MRGLLIGIIIFCGIILQSTVFDFIAVYGVKPDLILVIVISFGLLLGIKSGATVGLITGLVQDILAGGFIGINTSANFLAGLIAGFMEKKIFKENVLIPIIAVFIGTIMQGFFLLLLYWMNGVSYPFLTSIERLIIPESAYNSLIAPFVFSFIYRLQTFKFNR